jgi:hypothetical protein
VSFDADARDLAGVLLAAYSRTRAARRHWWLGMGTAAAVAIVAFVRGLPAGWPYATGFAAVTAAVVLALFAERRFSHRVRMLGYARGRVGPDDRFRVDVLVDADGVRVQSLGDVVLVEWADITSVEAGGEPVDIWVRGVDLIRVQARAFASAVDRERFVALVERYAAAARPPGS